MHRALFVLALAAAPAFADGRPPNGSTAKIDRIVATVNGAPIWMSQIDDSLLGDMPAADKLDALIDEELVIARAKADHITVGEDEIDAAMGEIKAQNGLDDAGLDKALADQHYTRPRYRRELARQILKLRAVNQEVAPTIDAKTPEERREKLGPAAQAWVAKLRATAHIEKHL